MNRFEKWLWQHKPPVIRSVWLRFLKHFVLASIISYGLFWVMSQMYLKSLSNKRSALFLLMLSIMSAKSWGWFFFIAIITSTLWGDWQNLRWRSLPKENPVAKDGGENESIIK